MRANEIMIGDWFYDTLSQTNKKVNRGDFEVNPLNDVCYAENLYPILLTPEILEKNGWEERPTGYVFYTDGKRYDNSLWYIFGSNTFVVNSAEFQIKYVHELQHAMRLCGIEKEIEL